jgi:uncharacterized protein (TIGR00156 family)
MKKIAFLLFFLTLNSAPSLAQFTGPSVAGQISTVNQISQLRLGSYVTLNGAIINHQRGDYFTFKDASGEIRIEIENSVWQGREVSPETKVRILAEVDQGPSGRYLWVKSLDIVK